MIARRSRVYVWCGFCFITIPILVERGWSLLSVARNLRTALKTSRNMQFKPTSLRESTRTETIDSDSKIKTLSTFYSLPLSFERWIEGLSSHPHGSSNARLERNRLFGRRRKDQPDEEFFNHEKSILFSYDYNVMEFGSKEQSKQVNTTGIVLIHPIGVGIAKWFYQRLLTSLLAFDDQMAKDKRRFVVVVPDLLVSGMACNATLLNQASSSELRPIETFPLLNISDWTSQIESLMETVGQKHSIDQWCLVANGGCSPIALQIAARSASSANPDHSKPKVSNVILSSVPRLSFFLERGNDPSKVKKAYRILCGVLGKLFWWYACRNEGAFIQQFSEKNLVADPQNLGDSWKMQCYETAIANGGKGRYSTFAFLAGTLQDGCMQSLAALSGSGVAIDIIKGRDVRSNRARSWFWQRKPKRKYGETTLRDYLRKQGHRGREAIIGGRISIAHEDANGYSQAMVDFLLLIY